MGRGRPRPPTPETLELERKVLELRRAGASFPDIEKQLKTPHSTVYSAYRRAIARTLREPAADVRALEADRLDRIQAAVWTKAMRGDLAAVDRVLRVMERRAELLGLDHKHGIAERTLQMEADKVRLMAAAFAAALEAGDIDEGARQRMTRVFLGELRSSVEVVGEFEEDVDVVVVDGVVVEEQEEQS